MKTHISGEGNEVGSRTTDREIIVELLLKLCFSILQKWDTRYFKYLGLRSDLFIWSQRAHLDIKDTDKIRPLRVVFRQTGHTTAPLDPGQAPVRPVHLDHCWAQCLQKGKQSWNKLNTQLSINWKLRAKRF